MKTKKLILLFSIEAAACLLFAILLPAASSGIFPSMLVYPLEQTGLLLRRLSLSGEAGNITAIVLYSVICLTPVILLLLLLWKRRLQPEDSLLAVLSALLFFVLYQMINSGFLIPSFSGDTALFMTKALLCGAVYSLICAYLLLRIVRLFFQTGTQKLPHYIMLLLVIINALFVYIIFGSNTSGLIRSFQSLKEANTGNEYLLGTSYIFLTLKYLVNNIPYVFNIVVIFAGTALLRALSSDRFSEESITAAERLCGICKISLISTVLTNTLFNLLQLFFIQSLNILDSNIQIPLFSILFVLGALLLSRFASENKALKDDLDSII